MDSIIQFHIDVKAWVQKPKIVQLPLPFFYQKKTNSVEADGEVLEKISGLSNQSKAIILLPRDVISGLVIGQLTEFCQTKEIYLSLEVK